MTASMTRPEHKEIAAVKPRALSKEARIDFFAPASPAEESRI